MRQATFIAVFVLLPVLLLAATSLCARGEIVNGSFEDSPDLNGWTIVTGTPAVRASFQEVVNEVLVHDFEPVEGNPRKRNASGDYGYRPGRPPEHGEGRAAGGA